MFNYGIYIFMLDYLYFIVEILDRYQEQPHLLDPHLGTVTYELFASFTDSCRNLQAVLHVCFDYYITKSGIVCGNVQRQLHNLVN